MTDPAPPPFQPPPPSPGYGPPPGPPTAPQPAAGQAPNGFAGMAADPSTLAATGLIAAVLFAVVAGLINFLAEPLPGGDEFRQRLLRLTDTVDVGDVALLGIAVVLLLLTPDPPGGLARPLLLQAAACLSALIAVYGVIRSLVLISADVSVAVGMAGFLATLGVAIAAATVAFYAAKESFLKKEGRI